jgi:tetratricopeptide (TPR) repeat protein
MMQANNVIGLAYSIAKDFNQAFNYCKKSIALAERIDPKGYLSKACNDIGVVYYVAALPDSGLLYAQRAVNIDAENRDTARLATSLSTVGENYMAAGEYEIALPFLRKSFAYLLQETGGENSYSLAYAYNDFAQAFFALKQIDSANYYAYRAIRVSLSSGYKDQLMRSYEYLYRSFDETGKHDSVSKYYRLAMIAKTHCIVWKKQEVLRP